MRRQRFIITDCAVTFELVHATNEIPDRVKRLCLLCRGQLCISRFFAGLFTSDKGEGFCFHKYVFYQQAKLRLVH